MIFGADSFNEILDDVEVTSCQVKSSDMLDQAIDQLLKEGVDAVIGGRSLSQVASRRNIPYILLQSGKESIYQAVEEAITAMRFSRSEKEKREYLQAIMDYSFEGIVSTDISGNILSVNRFAAERLNQYDRGRLIHQTG